MKFRVLEGKHTDLEGRTYGKGDVVTSNIDLCAKFANKFERLDGPSVSADYHQQVFDKDDVLDMTPEQLTEAREKAKDKPQLAETKKFETISPMGSPFPKTPFSAPEVAQRGRNRPKAKAAEEESEENGEEAEAEGGDERKEVTDRYPAAKEAGLHVFRDGTGYYVSDGSTDLNEEPMRKGSVNKFIRDHTSS